MNILSKFRDPARKQINTLSKDLSKRRRKNLKKCLYKDSSKVQFFFNVCPEFYDPKASPILIKVCIAAIQPGHQGRRETAIKRLRDLSSGSYLAGERLDFSKLHKDILPDLHQLYQRTRERLDFFKLHKDIVTAPLRDCLLDKSLTPGSRVTCAEILEDLGDKDFIIIPLRDYLSDESFNSAWKLQCAVMLARMGDQNAIEPIRAFIGSAKTIRPYDIPLLLETCYLLGIPEGKSFAYKEWDSALHEPRAGIYPKKNLEFAMLLLAKYLDDTALSLSEKLFDISVTTLEDGVKRRSGILKASEAEAFIEIAVKALASSENKKVIHLLVRFVIYAVRLQVIQRAHGADNIINLSNLTMSAMASHAINTWKQANNNYALTLLRHQVGGAEALMDSRSQQNPQTSYPARTWKDTTLTFPEG